MPLLSFALQHRHCAGPLAPQAVCLLGSRIVIIIIILKNQFPLDDDEPSFLFKAWILTRLKINDYFI